MYMDAMLWIKLIYFFLIKQIFTILDEMIMIIDDNQNKTHIYD